MTGHPFTAEAASQLGGPAWLAKRRSEVAGALATATMPSTSEEEWHYSRIGQLDLGAYHPRSGGPSGPGLIDEAALPVAAERLLAAVGARAGLAVTVDGRVATLDLGDVARSKDVSISALADAKEAPEGLGALVKATDVLTVLADAFLEDGVVVRVPPGVHVEDPIVLVHVLSSASSSKLVAPRTIVSIGEGAQASVIELLVSGDEPVLVVPVTEVHVGKAGHCSHMAVQQLGTRAWQIAYQASEVARDATFRSFVAAFGGDYARQRTHSVLTGENGESQLLAVYFGDGNQVQDFRTVQEHVAGRTRSELVFKGAVAGAARSVFSGLVHMHRGAKRADATQTNRNLVLSEGAHADSVPNLDIEENDVRCSHASAVGPVDAEQRFYLESRGIPTRIAERLVLLGFFEDLVSRAASPGYAAYVRAVVTSRLEASGVEAELADREVPQLEGAGLTQAGGSR